MVSIKKVKFENRVTSKVEIVQKYSTCHLKVNIVKKKQIFFYAKVFFSVINIKATISNQFRWKIKFLILYLLILSETGQRARKYSPLPKEEFQTLLGVLQSLRHGDHRQDEEEHGTAQGPAPGSDTHRGHWRQHPGYP